MAGGIFVFIERVRGRISDVAFEALGAGRRIAEALKVPVWAVAAGAPIGGEGSSLGAADGILVAEDPALDVPDPERIAVLLADLVEKKQATMVLLGGTNFACGIGGRLALRAKLPCVNFCKGVRFDGGSVVYTSQLFGGKILADVRVPDNRGVVVLYPGSFPAEEGKRAGSPPVEKVPVPAGASRVAFKRYIEPAAGDVDITRQDILVAVGRGIQTQDNIELAEELAGALGGVVCASRPVVDQGWLPMTRQVGKSGMTVKPKLYLALGISGAPEHQEGMKGSACIVAINTDPKAPIFDVAHYGAAADLLEVVPLLKEAVEKRKGAK